jgi:transcription elongation factor Elf1
MMVGMSCFERSGTGNITRMVELVFGCGDCGTILTADEAVDGERRVAFLTCRHCGESWEHRNGRLVKRERVGTLRD